MKLKKPKIFLKPKFILNRLPIKFLLLQKKNYIMIVNKPKSAS